ncbi:MAG: hypothetical protein HQL46_01165, partial [Gammaproteobacteria bacterium]|nr:hypothetical protein [Gammaproteobacteria bacterium]
MILITGLSYTSSLSAQAPFLKIPSSEVIIEAKKIVADMRVNLRGPYESVQWFCSDGSVLAPKSNACDKHGGGKQHAVFSAQRKRLAQLGWHVGTIYTSFKLSLEENTYVGRKHLRLRELPLEKYLIDIDDGWILHKARSYRGRVQLEDELQAGRELLLQILQDESFINENFLLLRELVRVIPHHTESDDPTRNIRRQSQLLAELDKSFEPLRAEIHGQPSQHTINRIKQWIGTKTSIQLQIQNIANTLIMELESLYNVKDRSHKLIKLSKKLEKSDQLVVQTVQKNAQSGTQEERLFHIINAIVLLRKALQQSLNATVNLQRLDLMGELEAELLTVARSIQLPASRNEILKNVLQLLQATQALGWLSSGELNSLATPINKVLLQTTPVSAQVYRQLIRRLQLVPAWVQGSIKHSFAEALNVYQALDVRSTQFVDDLLRSSSLMPLAQITHHLMLDSAQISGTTSSFFGNTEDHVWGLNPGIARGKLQIITSENDAINPAFNAHDIVVIPNTTSTLFPAAGIITIGEGNPLSHIQILARNLGIPNIVINES